MSGYLSATLPACFLLAVEAGKAFRSLFYRPIYRLSCISLCGNAESRINVIYCVASLASK